MSRKQQSKPTNRPDPGEHRAGNPLWDLANEIGRPNNLLTATKLISVAKTRGISVTWSDVLGLYNRSYLRVSGVYFIPSFLTDFIAAYVKGRSIEHILDPSVGTGSLLLPIVEAGHIPKAVAIGSNSHEIELAQAMSTTSSVEWVTGEPKAALDKLGMFDLIVSSPAWGGHPTSAQMETASGLIEVRDSEPNIIVLKAATHLGDDGEAIFILPNNFFFAAQSASVRNALPKLGLFIHAIITLAGGTFSPFTAIESNLVFVTKKKVSEIFVGRLTPGQDATPLLANFKKRKPGAAPELGRLVAPESYRGWHPLVAVEEKQRLAERSGLESVALRDIVEAVNLGKQTEDGDFENLPNCVYLPLIGTSPAVTSLSELKIKPQNYAQLVVRSDKAYAEFLAGFFNSPLGRKTRESMLSGTFIPKVTKQTILEATVYTLPMEAQKKATDAGREIQELRLRLEQLDRDLWSRPADAPKVRKAVTAISQKESFESWLETLPFPLASILWRYHAASNAEHKVVHLLNYFEAAAQFLGTLMASAFHSNQGFFREHRRDWFEGGKDNPHSLARSAFGEWVVRCQRLAKTTRQLLSDKEQRQLCLDMYRTTDAEKIESIANKGTYSVLETVGRYRNDWKGHSGIVSGKEHARHLALLQEEFTRLRGQLGGVFEDWWLIRPGKNSYTSGIYHYSAERLMGSRQIFKEEALDTTEVMDSNELYLFDATTRRPLQVLHFVRMMPSPETEEIACYFYNRLEKGGARWVSYHFEGKAERVEPDPLILKIIQEVEQNGD